MVIDLNLVPTIRHAPIKGDVVQVSYFDFDSDGYKDVAVVYREPLGAKLPQGYSCMLPGYRFYLALYRGGKTWYGKKKIFFSRPRVKFIGDGENAYVYARTVRKNGRLKNIVKFSTGESPYALWDDINGDGSVDYVFRDGKILIYPEKTLSFPEPVERAWLKGFSNSTSEIKVLVLLSKNVLYVYKLWEKYLKTGTTIYSFSNFLEDFPSKPWLRVEPDEKVEDFAEFLMFGDYDGDSVPDFAVVSEISPKDVKGNAGYTSSSSNKKSSLKKSKRILTFLQGGKNYTQVLTAYDVSNFFYFVSADFNLDGYCDMILFPENGRVTFAKSTGSFRFSLIATELVPGNLALAEDFTYDGVPDLLIGYPGRIQIQKGEKVTGLVMTSPAIGKAGRKRLPALLFGYRSGYVRLGDKFYLWATAPLSGEVYLWKRVKFVRLPAFQTVSKGFGLEAASGDIDSDGFDELVVLSENETFIYRGYRGGLQVGFSFPSPVKIEDVGALACGEGKIFYRLRDGKLVITSLNITSEKWLQGKTFVVSDADPYRKYFSNGTGSDGEDIHPVSFPRWGRFIGKISFERGLDKKIGSESMNVFPKADASRVSSNESGNERFYEVETNSIGTSSEDNGTVGGSSESKSLSPFDPAEAIPQSR